MFRFVARQLSHPTGLLGRLTGAIMNRANAQLNGLTLDALALGAQDRVLEIGFGGGVSLPTLLDQASLVAGIDPSTEMVERAKRRYARADLRVGGVEALPFDDRAFTKACTVNTTYFWPSLEGGMAEIHRVLAPGGRVAIGFLPKERLDQMGMPADIFDKRGPEALVAALEGAGFGGARVVHPVATKPWLSVAVATR